RRIVSLFIHDNPANRSTHSFPTRRSSDLTSNTTHTSASNHTHNVEHSCGTHHRHQRRPAQRPSPRPADAPTSSNTRKASPTDSRSEEHTSELQSRFDLVCRLLLEKNNKVA